jgi:iron(III) transport system substrate-binding protein
VSYELCAARSAYLGEVAIAHLALSRFASTAVVRLHRSAEEEGTMSQTRSRSRSRRLALPLFAATCLAVTAAACGDDDDDDEAAAPTTEGTAATEATAAETTAAAATTPETTTETTAGTATTAAAADDCIESTLAELTAAAEAEGSVTVYSSQGQDNLNALAAAFEAEYPGVNVEIVRDVDSTAIARVETERSTGSVTGDFVVSAAPAWVTEKAAEGWFLEPTGPQITCETDYDTAAYLHEGGVFEVSSVVFTYAWNTDLHPDGIDSYEGLLDPALSGGKIGVVDPAIAPVLVDFYHWLGDSFGDTYLQDLAAQEPRIYPGAQANQEAVISGEVLASAYVAPVPALIQAIEDGAPVDYGIPDEAWGAKFYGTIIDGAPHPNAAQLFANFMITPAGQELIHSGGTVLPDIEGALLTNDQVRDIDLESQQPDQVAAYMEEWNALFR